MGFKFQVKQAVLGAFYRIDQKVPIGLGICLRNRTWPWGRPILDSVQIHLVDHCNLNCAGCTHFSPFSAKWFADEESLAGDLSALRAKFKYIRHVVLLGGEPMLHPRCADLLRRVRAICPKATLTFVTNGILWLKRDAAALRALDACHEVRARVMLSVYPPYADRKKELKDLCAKAKVEVRTVCYQDFWAWFMPKGDGDIGKAFYNCRRTMYCPYLRDGRLYLCPQAYHMRDFAGPAKLDIPLAEGLDVHDESLTGRQMLRWLMTPCRNCGFCSTTFRLASWHNGRSDVKEWFR